VVKVPKQLGWLASAIGWLATVLTTPWAIVVGSIIATIVAALTTGLVWLEKPSVHAVAFTFVVVLWTWIALVLLATRKQKDAKLLRYGITFEGVVPNLAPNSTEHLLQIGVALRNFTQAPLKYTIEVFDVQIDSRTLPKYKKDSLSAVLSRGAQRISSNISFKYDHLKEFLGKRVEGTMELHLRYGDADKTPVRRLKMSFSLILEFPVLPPVDGQIPNFGFSAAIIDESDEPLEL
jgi:hypothetical protein